MVGCEGWDYIKLPASPLIMEFDQVSGVHPSLLPLLLALQYEPIVVEMQIEHRERGFGTFMPLSFCSKKSWLAQIARDETGKQEK